MKINFIPQSSSGKWSVGFGIVLFLSMLFSIIFALAIGGDPSVVEGNILLSILNVALNLTLNLSGLLSVVTGIYAVIKYKDWPVWKPVVILYGLTVLMFLFGEFLFPH